MEVKRRQFIALGTAFAAGFAINPALDRRAQTRRISIEVFPGRDLGRLPVKRKLVTGSWRG